MQNFTQHNHNNLGEGTTPGQSKKTYMKMLRMPNLETESYVYVFLPPWFLPYCFRNNLPK